MTAISLAVNMSLFKMVRSAYGHGASGMGKNSLPATFSHLPKRNLPGGIASLEELKHDL